MKRNDITNIEELLSCYIDDELSQRERTEVKRLIRNDKSVGKKLSEMQKQKELLNSLPTAAAPTGLLDNVKAMLTKEFVDEFIKGPKLKVPKRTKVVLEKPIEKIARPEQPVKQPQPVAEKQREKIVPPKKSVTQIAASKVYAQQTKQYNEYGDKPAGARDLLFRKMRTAAVLAIFLGSFGWVIYSIISPPHTDKPEMAANPKVKLEPAYKPPQVAKNIENEPVYSAPFNASLNLTTRKSIEVNDYLVNAIFRLGLLDYTIPKRQPDKTSYNINCNSEAIIALVKDMSKVWDKLGTASMKVSGETVDLTAMIDGVTAEQAVAVLKENDRSKRINIAKDFALANAIEKSISSQNSIASTTDNKKPPTEPSTVIEPILTKSQLPKYTENTESPKNTDQTKTATLTIIVIGL